MALIILKSGWIFRFPAKLAQLLGLSCSFQHVVVSVRSIGFKFFHTMTQWAAVLCIFKISSCSVHVCRSILLDCRCNPPHSNFTILHQSTTAYPHHFKQLLHEGKTYDFIIGHCLPRSSNISTFDQPSVSNHQIFHQCQLTTCRLLMQKGLPPHYHMALGPTECQSKALRSMLVDLRFPITIFFITVNNESTRWFQPRSFATWVCTSIGDPNKTDRSKRSALGFFKEKAFVDPPSGASLYLLFALWNSLLR